MADVSAYAFSDPWAGVDRGRQLGNALRQDQSYRTAGTALAGGDYAGGANALLSAGQIQNGLQVRTIGEERAAAPAAAEKEQQDELVKATAELATNLSGFHHSLAASDPAAAKARTLAAYDQAAPHLKAKGATDEDLALTRQHIEQDPEGTFAALGAAAFKHLGYDVKVVGDQVVATDRETGKAHLVASTGGASAPAASAAPGVAPASTGPANADALWAAIKHQESGGLASPGTAVGPDTPYGNALGSTQMLPATAEAMARKVGVPWNPALMRENSPKALAYQDQLGRAYLQEGLDKNGGDPAAGAAYYFGGPDLKLHGPKTAAYVKAVLARAGAAPAAASDHLEGGAGGDVPGSVDANGVLHLAPKAAKAPVWKSDGKGYLHNENGDIKKDPSYGGEAATADPKLVQMLIDGRAPMPAPSKRTDPAWLAALDAAAQQDPTFDAANYQTRVKTRQSFLSGKDHQNIVAINTLVGHLDRLDHHIDNLRNAGGFPGSHLINMGKHFVQEQSGTAEGYTQFEADKEAVVTEATKVFRGASGAEADVRRNLENLKTANSPGELHAAVQEIAHLMNSRLESVADGYKQGMGKSSDPMDFLYPAQKDAFSRIMSGAKARAAPAEAQRLSPEQAAKLAPGTHFVGLDGVERTRK